MKKIILTLILFITCHFYASSQIEAYIGEIRMFAGNFAPVGWAFCQGQLLPIDQNEALFTILGTTYGGDGRTTFALPDLRGRVPVHQGNLQGSNFVLGQIGGTETKTLTTNNLPAHSHSVTITQPASKREGTSKNPEAMYPAVDGTNLYGTPEANAETITSRSTTVTITPSGGSGQPVENKQPYLGINFIICLEGIFPPRN